MIDQINQLFKYRNKLFFCLKKGEFESNYEDKLSNYYGLKRDEKKLFVMQFIQDRSAKI